MHARGWLVAGLMLGIAWGCKNPQKPDNPLSNHIVVDPTSLSFDDIGLNAQLHLSYVATQQPPDSFWHIASTNPQVATAPPSGSTPVVTSTGTGSAFIHITLTTTNDSADIPVTVSRPAVTSYNGTYKGEAKQVPALLQLLPSPPRAAASCPGSSPGYAETAALNVNAAGAGTFTLTDTPGFDRAYQVTVPASLAFSGTGTFSLFGAPVPGQVNVTIDDATHLTFKETTTYGTCSNTYGGQLTKQ
jgi:hypothetical protein